MGGTQAAMPSAHMSVGYTQAAFDMVQFYVAVQFINPLSQSYAVSVILFLQTSAGVDVSQSVLIWS